MNIERHYKILGWLWLMFGGGISLMLMVQLYHILVRPVPSIMDNVPLESLLIVVGFLTCLSGWALFKRKSWGRIAIIVTSLTYIAYGFLYILFHGAEEEGTITTIIVMCLLVLGLYSLFFLLITSGRKDNTGI